MSVLFELDRKTILARLGGDEEILEIMIDAFLSDYENNCQQLLAAWSVRDAGLIAREAHTLKGLLATLSDESGADQAYLLEQKARQGAMADQDAMVDALVQRVRTVAGVLSAR